MGAIRDAFPTDQVVAEETSGVLQQDPEALEAVGPWTISHFQNRNICEKVEMKILIGTHLYACVQVRSVVEKEMGRPMSAKDICSVLDHGTTSEAHMYL